jgi:hypothetical protein
MKTIFFTVPEYQSSQNPITAFCDNPTIKVHAIKIIPGLVTLGFVVLPKIMVEYDSLTDQDAVDRATYYESLTLKRLCRIADRVIKEDKVNWNTLKNEEQRRINLLAFYGISQHEAEVVSELIRMPAVRVKMLEEP